MTPLYYSVRSNDVLVPWDQHSAQTIDMIMKLTVGPQFSDPERTITSARYQYPKGTYIFVHRMDEWEYDMLDAFGVPLASQEIIDAFMKSFRKELLVD